MTVPEFRSGLNKIDEAANSAKADTVEFNRHNGQSACEISSA